MSAEFLHQYYLDQPYEVSLETLALCNAKCTFCPYETLARKGEEMPSELIHRLIEEMASFEIPFYISPFKVNEPFLDKRLIGICSMINRCVPRARIRLFSNGSPLTEAKLLEINRLNNIEHLWISLNATDASEYQRIMGLVFDRTARRLDDLHRLFANGYFRHPVVLSKVSTTPREEIKFAEYCADRWPNFSLSIIKQDGWLGYVPPSNPAIPDTPCVRWFELSILATGTASLCCMDGKGEFPIGDVKKQSLLEIYNSPHWRQRRLELWSRQKIYPCSTCTY